MDNEALVMEIRKTLTKFMQDKYKINIAILVKDMDSDTYTFLLASQLLDLLTPYDGTKSIAEYFYNNLSKEAFRIISRINIINTKDPSILPIARSFNTSNGISVIKNCKFGFDFFNVDVDDAIILEAHMD